MKMIIAICCSTVIAIIVLGSIWFGWSGYSSAKESRLKFAKQQMESADLQRKADEQIFDLQREIQSLNAVIFVNSNSVRSAQSVSEENDSLKESLQSAN